MSLEQNNSSCVRCKSYLFSEDDVVYCPICGAPHHRECYNAIGHCALEELHGTEQEYSREKVQAATDKQQEKEQEKTYENTVKCQMCGNDYEASQMRCPECGSVNVNKANVVGFDFLGGVPADLDIDGVTADEAKQFVFANTHRYIPKFATLNKINKASWNWMAFLFPAPWLLARKMYNGGILTGLLEIAASCMLIPFNFAVINVGVSQTGGYMQYMKDIVAAMPEIGKSVIILAFIGMVLSIAISLVFGIFGDYFYKKYVVASIKRIKAQSEDKATDFRKKGGVNLILFMLGFMCIQYLPAIIILFL